MTIKENIRLSNIDATAGESPTPLLGQRLQYRLIDFVRMLRVRRAVILGTALAVILATLIGVLVAKPTYTATATVMLDERKNNITDLTAVLQGVADQDPSLMGNQVQIISSRAVAARVVAALKLDSDPEFNGDEENGLLANILHWVNPKHWTELFGAHSSEQGDEEESLNDAVIDAFLADLSADQVVNTTTATIAFTSENPAKAARIANALADAYVEDDLNTKFDAAKRTAQWAGGRLKELGAQVAAADAAVEQYRIANNLTQIGGNTPGTTPSSINDEQVVGITTQLVQAKTDLAEKEAAFQRVSELAKSGHAEDVSAVVASPLIATLRGQEADLLRQEADLTSRYGPRNPKILDLESQKANLQAKIAEEVQRVVETVRSDMLVARAHVNSLNASLETTSTKSQYQAKAMAKLAELQATANTAQTLYQTVLSKFNDAESQSAIQTPDTRVLSNAVIPDEPSAPRKARDLLLASVAGLLMGLALAFAIEHLDVGFRTSGQIEMELGLPVLAAILEVPITKGASPNPADRVIDEPTSHFTESIRGIELGLRLSRGEHPPRVVVAMSAVPGEGKSTVAIALARLAASTGHRVLLIDCDLRNPSLAKGLGLHKVERGVVEVLSDIEQFDKALLKDTKSDAKVLACVRRMSNAADLLDSDAMKQVIRRARAQYDLVVVDSAPLLPVHDSWILSGLGDAVLLTVRWEKTPREAVRHAVQILLDLKAPIGGVVLTRAKADRFRYYSFGYQDYREYNKYYTG